MYAIFEDGGRQYRVQEGDIIRVDLRDLDEGQTQVEFDRVLFVGGDGADLKVGRPVVEGAKIVARVGGEVKGDKVIGVVFRRRKNVRVKKGHRQRYLDVTIEKIVA